MAIALGVLLAACADGPTPGDDATQDASLSDATPQDATPQDASTIVADATAPDAGPLGENGVFDCNTKSPDSLAASVEASWRLVDSIEVDADIATRQRFAVSPAGETLAFNIETGLVESWGTWPAIAPSNNTFDPKLPAHSVGSFDSTTAYFEGDTYVLIYFRFQGGGGVFVRQGTQAGRTFVGTNVTSARLVNGRLLVGAAGLLGVGENSDSNSTKTLWGIDLDEEPATAQELVRVDAPVSEFLHVGRLGDDLLLSVATAPSFNADFVYAGHKLSAASLASAEAPITLPAPDSAALQGEDVVDSFDIDNGIAIVVGMPPLLILPGLNVKVVRANGAGFSTESPIALPTACTELTHAFSVDGDLVVGIRDTVTNERRFLQLRRR